MKKITLILLVALLASCVGRDDVSFTGVNSYELKLPSAVDVSLGVENRSGTKLLLRSCELQVYYRGNDFMKVTLAGPATVPAHFAGNVPLSFRLGMDNPLSALMVMGNPRRAAESMTVSGEIIVRAGIKRKKIKIDNQPVKQLMTSFGISY